MHLPTKRILHVYSRNHCKAFIDNEMTTPKGYHDTTIPTDNLSESIISYRLQIIKFTQ